jgi:transcriptional regulator with XRE-family HTH domain
MAKETYKPDLDRIDQLRVKAGLSWPALAKAAIISSRTLDSIRKGEPADISTLRKIANALETTPDTLIPEYMDHSSSPRGEQHIKVHIRYFDFELTLSIPFQEFDETKDLPRIIQWLMKHNITKEQVIVSSVGPGSTVVSLRVATSDAYRLFRAFKDGRLAILDVLELVIKPLRLCRYLEYMCIGMFLISAPTVLLFLLTGLLSGLFDYLRTYVPALGWCAGVSFVLLLFVFTLTMLFNNSDFYTYLCFYYLSFCRTRSDSSKN